MGYHTHTLLETTVDATGDAVGVAHLDRLLVVATLSGTATCQVQGRLVDGSWRALATFTVSGELNLDNFGWHELRAVASDLDGGSVAALLSWR